jgi:hypothetical protein
MQLIDFTRTARSKNHENYSSCRMNFVRNEIVNFFKKMSFTRKTSI